MLDTKYNTRQLCCLAMSSIGYVPVFVSGLALSLIYLFIFLSYHHTSGNTEKNSEVEMPAQSSWMVNSGLCCIIATTT